MKPCIAAICCALSFAMIATLLLAVGEDFFTGRNPRPDSARVATVRAKLDLLTAEWASLSLRIQKLGSFSPSRKSIATHQIFEADLASFEARLLSFQDMLELSPRLVQPIDGGRRSKKITDILYSLGFYRKVILDPHSSPLERAWAFASFVRLPESSLHFTEDLKAIWIRDVFLADTSEVLERLAGVYAWVRPKSDDMVVKNLYADLLLQSSNFMVRASAVSALEWFCGNPEMRGIMERVRVEDPSEIVRSNAESFLRKNCSPR